MKFWIIRQTRDEQAIGCETSKAAAKAEAASMGYEAHEVYFDPCDYAVNADTICRLLGNRDFSQ